MESIIFADGLRYSISELRRVARGFSIQLTYSPSDKDLVDRWSQEIQAALSRWSEVIVGTAQGDPLSMRIDLTAPGEITGGSNVLARGWWSSLNDHGTPAVGKIKIGRANVDLMEKHGIVASTLAHEFGHAIGLDRPMWERRGFYHDGAGGPSYSGAKAVEIYGELSGAPQARVPLENKNLPGTYGYHWRASTFGRHEVMVGVISGGPRKYSRLTLGGLADIGYSVNWAAADDYDLRELDLQGFDELRDADFLCVHDDEGASSIVVSPDARS